jgi:hypothetical protein
MSQEKPSKKLSRSARYNKKRRLNKEQKPDPMGRSSSTLPADQNEHTPTIPLSISDIPPEIRLDTPCIIFDPNHVYTFLISPISIQRGTVLVSVVFVFLLCN